LNVRKANFLSRERQRVYGGISTGGQRSEGEGNIQFQVSPMKHGGKTPDPCVSWRQTSMIVFQPCKVLLS
jgi:3-deoxy-D-arabino-heptulosonate 7-phosphate (DAHP) synthase